LPGTLDLEGERKIGALDQAARSVNDLARREGIDGRSVRRLIPLGFLAPRIIEAIAEGRQPVELTVEALTRRIDLPLLWSAQLQALGIE
jgi:site-specific DNA recombinase